MSERNWGEADSTPAPKKKGIPTWLWFCGGGCLLAVILAVAAGGWMFSKFKGSLDPEQQWPAIAEFLPFDERPPELQLQWGSDVMFGMYIFEDSRGYAAVLMRLPAASAADRERLMDPESKVGFMGFGDREDARASKLKVQGRELHVLRFTQMSDAGGETSGGRTKVGPGPSALVDLTRDGDSRPLILQLIHLRAEGEVSDDVISEFLKPFHVGPVR